MQQKTCPKCQQTKPLTEFNKNKGRKDGHQGVCKKCQAAYTKQHYQNTKEVYKRRSQNQKHTTRLWLQEYKKRLQCELCSENHPACIQFHHKNPTDKEFAISMAINEGYAINTIKKELKKCQVLCANCHFKIHHTGS